jgi:iron-sulfur cluster insertion protein
MSEIQFNNQLSDEINISPEAVEQLLAITADETDVAGVRVFVSGGGCGGMEYGMTLVEEPSRFDSILETQGLKLYIDSVALGFLEGVEIDYKAEGINKSFVFRNVFANSGGAGTCGTCGAVGGGCGS